MDYAMVSVDEFKKMLKDAEMDAAREFDKPKDIFYEIARRIVNIERQSYYGDESPNRRLGRIREEIVNASKKLRAD